jgi:hypothetical protein
MDGVGGVTVNKTAAVGNIINNNECMGIIKRDEVSASSSINDAMMMIMMMTTTTHFRCSLRSRSQCSPRHVSSNQATITYNNENNKLSSPLSLK